MGGEENDRGGIKGGEVRRERRRERGDENESCWQEKRGETAERVFLIASLALLSLLFWLR